MRNENVRKFTVSSLYLAIAVILIVGASVIPGFDLTLLAVASAVGAFTIVEGGIRYGAVQYAAAAILGFLLAPDKSAAILYLIFFGIYPVVKYFAEKPKKPWVQWVIKCGFCLAVCIVALAAFSELVLGDLTLPEWFPFWGLVPAALALFLIYDYALTIAVRLYDKRVHSKETR